jgi:hypothetical protein
MDIWHFRENLSFSPQVLLQWPVVRERIGVQTIALAMVLWYHASSSHKREVAGSIPGWVLKKTLLSSLTLSPHQLTS